MLLILFVKRDANQSLTWNLLRANLFISTLDYIIVHYATFLKNSVISCSSAMMLFGAQRYLIYVCMFSLRLNFEKFYIRNLSPTTRKRCHLKCWPPKCGIQGKRKNKTNQEKFQYMLSMCRDLYLHWDILFALQVYLRT